MLVRDKKHFVKGLLMLITFGILFCALLFPIMRDERGNHLTGLQYADNVFNELSKGSSNFIPQCRQVSDTMKGKTVTVSIPYKKAELMDTAIAVFKKAGLEAKNDNGRFAFSGDLGAILGLATDMSEKLYQNDAKSVVSLLGMEAELAKVDTSKFDPAHKDVMAQEAVALQAARAVWYALSPSIKALQKQSLVGEAKAVDQVLRRAVEPGNNYYSVEPVKVKDHIVLLAAMLIFYILYTLWYGFSIFELFEGLGLAMTKSKAKAES